MYFGHNSKHMQNSPHLTRWVAPYPQYTPSIALIPQLMLVSIKLKKGQNPICTFHFHPLYRHPDRHTDAPTCMIVAPRHSTTFLPNFIPETLSIWKLHSF